MANVFRYALDAKDRIQEIVGPWDDFAEENGAPALTADDVVGTVLWDHIHGHDARNFHRALLERARTTGHLVYPFRCDAPDRRRFMRMDVQMRADRTVFTSEILREEIRPRVELLTGKQIDPSSTPVPICAHCRKVSVSGEWFEIEEAAATLGLDVSERTPPLRETICGNCARAAAEAG